jgi:hypothetical protein
VYKERSGILSAAGNGHTTGSCFPAPIGQKFDPWNAVFISFAIGLRSIQFLRNVGATLQ